MIVVKQTEQFVRATSNRGKLRRGATVLEMAVVAPTLLILLLGMLDLSIAVYASNTLAEAVRAGARYAAVRGSKSTSPLGPTANNATVETIVKASSPGIATANLTVNSTWPSNSNDPGRTVQVSATYNYRPAIAWVFGVKTWPLKATSTMEISH